MFKFKLSNREQLLMILLRITSLVISKIPPKRKDDSLGGKLAQALFQVFFIMSEILNGSRLKMF